MKLPSLLAHDSYGFFASVFLLAGVTTTLAAPIVSLMPPEEWPATDWYQANYGSPTVQTVAINSKEWLSVSRASSAGGAQLVYTAGSYTVDNLPVPNEVNQLADFRGSVVVAASSWNAIDAVGVVLRSRVSAYHGAEAYYLGLSSSGLGLYWGVGNSFISNVTPLAIGSTSETLDAIGNGGEYLLSFSVAGNKIDAAVYSTWTLDEEGNPLGTAIASISYIDTREEARESGYFALRANRLSGSGRTMYMRDLQIHAIPEPASVASLGVGGAFLLMSCWRHRRAFNA